MQLESNTYKSFSEFYPIYLNEHQNKISRVLHCIGTILCLCLLFLGFITGKKIIFLFVPIVGYGFAWSGHFFFEKNKPTTFRHPLYSLMGDIVMLRDILIKKISL
jgi:hypothetical protein